MSDDGDLLLARGETLEDAAEAFGARLTLRADGEEARTERHYYETFDGLLRHAGLSLVHCGGRLSLVSRAVGERACAEEECASAPTRVLPIEMATGPLRDALLPVVDVRALLPVAAVESRSLPLAVLDELGKTVVRLVLEQPSLVVAASGRIVPLRARVRLTGLRGYDAELARVRGVLRDDLGLPRAGGPVLDDAVVAAGGDPRGVSSKPDVELSREERSDEAAVAVLMRLGEITRVNLPGTIADIDAEFLHDFRVAVRRTRSVQRELRGVFPPDALAYWRGELRWLQQITGPSRDLDVYVLDFEEFRAMVPEAFRAELEPLLTVLRSRRLAARRAMVRELRTERAEAILTGWPAFLAELRGLPEGDRPDAARPVAAVAGARIDSVYRRMVKMGDAIGPETPAEAYHELRKKGKELRYLLELFGAPLFPREVVSPMVKTLKALQDTLGRHQDREVQVDTLRGLTGEVASLPGGAQALMAMGLLVDRLGIDERAARGEFVERFEAFAAKPQRKLVRATFRV